MLVCGFTEPFVLFEFSYIYSRYYAHKWHFLQLYDTNATRNAALKLTQITYNMTSLSKRAVLFTLFPKKYVYFLSIFDEKTNISILTIDKTHFDGYNEQVKTSLTRDLSTERTTRSSDT